MYVTIDPETGKQVIMYEIGMSGSFPSIDTKIFLKKDSPIFNSKNSHKRTNKRKR